MKPLRPQTSKKPPQIKIFLPKKSSITKNKMLILSCSAKAFSAPHISMVLTLKKTFKKHHNKSLLIYWCWDLFMASKMHNTHNRNSRSQNTPLLSIWKKASTKIIYRFITNTIYNISKSTKAFHRTVQVKKISKISN